MSQEWLRIQGRDAASSDRELVAAACDGSVDAFGELFERYRPSIFRFFRHRVGNEVERAEDLTQETFLLALAHLQDLHDRAKFKSWLYTIARTTLLMNVRRRNRRPCVSLDQLLEQDSTSLRFGTGSKSIEGFANRELLAEVLQSLTPTAYRAFMMHYVAGYSIIEIAEVEKVTPAAAQSRSCRAKRELEMKLDVLLQQSSIANEK